MNVQELDALLVKSLADHKLSGSERESILGFALKQIDSDPDRHLARSRAFVIARDAATHDELREALTWVEDVLKTLSPVVRTTTSEASAAFFSPGESCLGQIVHRFASARRSADVCVFTITDDRITRALLDAHRRGVKVRVITDNEKEHDRGSDIGRIRDAKVPVRVDRTPFHMHHKFALFDGARLLNGSYNWTVGAERDNEENIIDTGEPRLIAAFQAHFEELWAKLVD